MDALNNLVALIPLFPLLGSLLAYASGRRFAGIVATSAAALSFATVVYIFLNQPAEGYLEKNLFEWFAVGDLQIDFLFRFDHLTAVMCLVITGIGSLIHLYSMGYMAEDPSRHRFFSYLNLFLFSMLLLVLGGNLLVLFIGWEGVGLCSYLLIGFWYQNVSYASAGRKAFVVNRIGDAGFLLATFLLYQQFKTLDFVQLGNAIAGAGSSPEVLAVLGLAAFCFFIGATGKSAQIPLFVWLPDAMAGPTPVSALIHAATMVTAGVYLVARLHFLFTLTPFVMAIVCVVASLTALLAATIALTQTDIKKVLAYSTVSQLGFMFLAASVGAYWVAIFHVVTHAFFKACLFLGAGSVIHGCHHEQDMREMGGLAKYMPLTFATYLVSTLAIAGVYPFSGFQSKHAILEAVKGTTNPYLAPYAGIILAVASFTAFLTAFYMTRSVALTFLGKYRGHAHPHESPPTMTIPLLVLGGLATVGGIYLGHHLPEFLSTVVPVHPGHHDESIVTQIMQSWVGLLGIALALLLYTALRDVPGKIFGAVRPISTLLSNKYYLDELYAAVIIRPLEGISRGLWRGVDQGVIDGAVNGTAGVVDVSGEILRGTQTGQIRHYALFMLGSALLLIGLYLVL